LFLYLPSDGRPGDGRPYLTTSQFSFIHPHGDILTPAVIFVAAGCGNCVSAGLQADLTDTSFSFRGLSAVTTITSMPEPMPVSDLRFIAISWGGGDIDITHGASNVSAVPEPSTWAMMILGLLRNRNARAV
jgi:hypothetical protein